MKLRSVAMTGVLSLAGLGLVGAGAHAVFTTSTASNQTVTAGTAGPVITPVAPLQHRRIVAQQRAPHDLDRRRALLDEGIVEFL